MKRSQNIVAYAGILIGLIATLAGLGEIALSKQYYADYQHMYGLKENLGLHWQFKSMSNFRAWQSILIVFWVGYTILNIFFLFKRRKLLFRMIVIIDIVLLIWFIRYQILQVQSGYDHYPGFDPYLL
jgi:hypothetical protein